MILIDYRNSNFDLTNTIVIAIFNFDNNGSHLKFLNSIIIPTQGTSNYDTQLGTGDWMLSDSVLTNYARIHNPVFTGDECQVPNQDISDN